LHPGERQARRGVFFSVVLVFPKALKKAPMKALLKALLKAGPAGRKATTGSVDARGARVD